MKPKSTLHHFLPLAGSSLLAISSAHADSGNWTYDGATAASLLWSEATSWSSNPTVPGTTAGDVITFSNNITAARTITIDTTSRTVGQLTIGDSNNTHFFTLAASGGAGLTFDNSGSGATITSTNATLATVTTARDTISAPITLADNLAVSVAGSWTLAAGTSAGYFGLTGNIGESGGVRSITKNGNGALVLTGNNSYSGGFTLNAGSVQVTLNSNEVNNSYTGFGTGTLTINGGTIATRSAGSFTTANDSVWNGNFSLYRGQTGVATWNHEGDVTLGGNINVTPTNNGFILNISGDIGETGGARSLTFSNGNLTPTLSGNNTYSGGTNVTSGTIRFAKTASMSDTGTVAMATGTTLIVNAGGTGEFTGATSGNGSIGGLLAASAIGGKGAPVTWAGSSRLAIDTTNATGGSLTYSGTIANRGTSMGITKLGSGTLALTATDSSYTGSTVISSGVLEVSVLANAGSASSIGQSSNLNTNLIINTGATLRYTGTGGSTNRIFRIDGGSGSIVTLDASGSGAINFTDTTNPTASGSNLTATIVLAGTNTDANTYAANYGNNGTGVRNLEKTGTGTWVLTGTNTYTGTTTATGGTLITTKASSLAGYNVAGKVVFNGGTHGVRIGGAGWTTGEVDTLLSNATKTSGALGIDTTNGDLTQWTAFTTTNLGSTLGLNKLGTNTLTLDQSNTYTGATTVSAGTLLINGSTSSTSLVTVNNGATLGGNGTIGGAVSVNGFLKPGNSTGLLTVGSLDLNTGASTTFEINGTNRGAASNGYDALGVNTGGSIDLAGALIFEFGNLAAFAANTEFDLFSFDTTSTGDFDSVVSTGFYAGTWSKSGDIWSLTDEGQTLNFSEVTGNLVAVPEPRAALLGGLGLLVLLRRRRQG